MNLGEGIIDFRAKVGDTKKPYFWPDGDVVPWFNEAENEACIRAGLIYDIDSTVTQYDVSLGDMTIDLDPGIIGIKYAALTDANGTIYPINPTDRLEMDRVKPDWRTDTRRPDGYIHNDKTLILNAPSDAAYTLNIECTRKPCNKMTKDSDQPEIAENHHMHLVDWVMYRAYSKPDADRFNPTGAKDSLERFEDYFGKPPKADLGKKQQANRPHRNVPCW